MIKMIIMDMDGTLLNEDQEITAKTKQALLKAQEQGITLVLASGRSYRTLYPYGLQLNMDKNNGYFICSNGAVIASADLKRVEFIKQLEPEEVQEVFLFAKDYDVEIMAVQDNYIHDYIPDQLMKLKKEYRKENNIDEKVPYTSGTFALIVDQSKLYDNIEYVKEAKDFTEKANKMTLSHEPEELQKLYQAIVPALSSKYNFALTSPRWLEVAPLNINKGNTILQLASELSIQPEEIMVFGDGENDLSMFEVVKYGIAMGNAMPTVKEVAYDVTATNNEDGIAQAIEKYVFN